MFWGNGSDGVVPGIIRGSPPRRRARTGRGRPTPSRGAPGGWPGAADARRGLARVRRVPYQLDHARRQERPEDGGGARPWFTLIGHLLGHDPEGAGRAARGWYTTLMQVNFEMDGDPLPHRAIAAYVAGIIEAYLFNDVKAEHWLEVGHSEAEADGDIWVPLFLATRFVRGAVRST